MRSHSAARLGCLILALTLPFCSQAQDAASTYPDRPVTVVVPFATGGTTTTLTRLMADRLSQELKQTFIVENRPGAGGNIAFDHVAKAKPDGYTLLMGSMSLTTNPAIYSKVNYDPVNDYAPISLYGSVANILAVNAKLPIHNLAELIAYTKKNPGTLTQGSSGNGSSSHFSGLMLRAQAGIDFIHVPYKGGALAMQDVLGGQISMLFDQIPAVYPHVISGGVRAIGVTTPKRSSGAPDVPTFAEQGLKDFDVTVWYGFVAPKNTPAPIIAKLNTAMVKALKDPKFVAQLNSMGVDPMPSTPEEYREYIKADLAKWNKIAKESGAEKID
jgi:tripartite-type tricarboxylate transporter receptor subunit TctC